MRTLLRPASASPVATDVALLLSRVALGLILLVHGWQKLTEFTLEGTAGSFAQMGVPLPTVAAGYVIFAEVVGGAALILGLLAPLAALLNVVSMLGALVLVHAPNGVFVTENGYELVLAIFAGLALVTVLGAGRFSIDGLLGGSRAESAQTAQKPVQSSAAR